MGRHVAYKVAFTPENRGVIRFAQSRRALDNRLEDRLDMFRRTADDPEYLRHRRLPLQRLAQIVGALAQLVEQPRILDGDHGLGGEIRQQLDLFGREWANLLAKNAESADELILLEHWHDDKAARARNIDKPHNRRIAGCVTRLARNIGDVDNLFYRGDPPKGDIPAWTKYRVATIFFGPCRRRPVDRRQSKCIRIIKEQISELGPADARGILKHGLEYRLQFARRRTYDA